MTRLFIDADACPVTRDAISIARARGVPVTLVANSTQSCERYTQRKGVDAVQVGVGSDAADFAIIELLAPSDVVVTQDIGLAAMVLGRGARALSPRGRIFSRATIDLDLELRHAEKRERRAGRRTHGGPRAFEEEDRERFSAALERLLGEALRGA